jgi:hypothetical protein
VIQRVWQAGLTAGEDMIMYVKDQDVCSHCRRTTSGIAEMAEAAGLRYLRIFATDEMGAVHEWFWTSDGSLRRIVRQYCCLRIFMKINMGPGRWPTIWAEVEAALNNILSVKSGMADLTLTNCDASKYGELESISVSLDNFMMRLSVMVFDGSANGEGVDAVFYKNADVEPGLVEFRGDLESKASIFNDPIVVYAAFKQFFETGDISKDIIDVEKYLSRREKSLEHH